jgi:hypothetical protein
MGVSMAINKAFLGHSLFTELSVDRIVSRYQAYQSPNPHPAPRDPIDRFVFALQDMQISNVWIQLFTRPASDDPADFGECDPGSQTRATLIQRLGEANINWVGWGYCAGKYWTKCLTLIQKLHHDLAIPAFMIDAEPGNKIYPNPQFPNDSDKNLPDVWANADFDTFTADVLREFGQDNLALTTWPMLQIQDDATNPVVALMRIAAPRVCAFVPQAYWMSYPTTVHYNTLGLSPHDYPPNDPVSFVRMTIKAWSMLGFAQPLAIAGQAYWGEGGTDQNTMTGKVSSFAANFADWSQIIGFGWYNAGLSGDPAKNDSMSNDMITAIRQAKLGAKPYKQPAQGVI